ncbi:cytochrome c [Terrarubrum flagellatum]|uniref:c-type cytochrome n=1 Tax=Terrirubrum flagellatum TaxID=2895980 RepID=UPI00314510DC
MIRKAVFILALAAVGATAAYAQDVIAQRKDLMKANGAAAGTLGRMASGAAPFDLAAAQAALKKLQEDAKALPALFPAGSDKGETRALPAVFTEKDKFNAIFAKMDTDAGAALTAVTDAATLKTEVPKVLANCGACHTPYRKSQ